MALDIWGDTKTEPEKTNMRKRVRIKVHRVCVVYVCLYQEMNADSSVNQKIRCCWFSPLCVKFLGWEVCIKPQFSVNIQAEEAPDLGTRSTVTVLEISCSFPSVCLETHKALVRGRSIEARGY